MCFHRYILSLMRLLINSKVRFTSLIFISEMRVAIGDEGDSPLSFSDPPTVGSLIQRMYFIVRWAWTKLSGRSIFLQWTNTAEDSLILDIISNEIYSRLHGLFNDRTIAYRHVERTKDFIRLVPVLQAIDHHLTREVKGTSVVGPGQHRSSFGPMSGWKSWSGCFYWM